MKEGYLPDLPLMIFSTAILPVMMKMGYNLTTMMVKRSVSTNATSPEMVEMASYAME